MVKQVHIPGRLPAALAFILISFALASPAGAAFYEGLVMPGPVIEGHAKYEEECSECHRPFSKTTQRELCLDCHEKVAVDVKEKKGYHGKYAPARETECRHCHTDHKGRDAEVVLFDPVLFDHDMSDFPLKEGHKRAECSACHEPKKLFREAPAKCIDCHKEDDSHDGELGKDCAKCHKEGNWKKSKFDHDKTDFKLSHEHRDVACVSCHPGNRYEDTPDDCYSCHALNDVHKGQYGKKCSDCHTERGWDKKKFDHDETDYRLRWKHEDVACSKCHTGKDVYKEELKDDCYSCHENDDTHRGRYGRKCEDCHSERGWDKEKFDHDETDFKLKHKHRDVECVSCHRGPVEKDAEARRCYDCHRPDDVHRGDEGRGCGACHNEKGWRSKVLFDHDLTRFPLVGLHAVAPCEQCHVDAVYKATPTECVDCHSRDDDHDKALGPECGACHNPNDWRLWRFDHDRETDFKLDGSHEGLGCGACHTRPMKKEVKASSACSACHREDDYHRGGFGMNCSRCHTTESFREIKMVR